VIDMAKREKAKKSVVRLLDQYICNLSAVAIAANILVKSARSYPCYCWVSRRKFNELKKSLETLRKGPKKRTDNEQRSENS